MSQFEDEYKSQGKTIQEMEDQLDAALPEPKKKTPGEMKQDPNSLLDPQEDPEAQKAANNGHDWSINDNDSRNGPA